MIQAEQLHARILEELDLSRDIPDEELTELIHRVLDEASGREYIPLGKKAELGSSSSRRRYLVCSCVLLHRHTEHPEEERLHMQQHLQVRFQ